MNINNIRRSIKVFDKEKNIPLQEWKYIEEVAYHAPTSMNWQPWRAAILDRKTLVKLTDKEVLFNKEPITTSDKMIVFLAPTEDFFNEGTFAKDAIKRQKYIGALRFNPNAKLEDISDAEVEQAYKDFNSPDGWFNANIHWARRQAYIALGMTAYAAAEKQIDSLIMEGFATNELQKFLLQEGLSEEGWEPLVLISFGYRPENYKMQPTERKSKEYKFFKK